MFRVLTKSLQCISHGLILHHVNQSSAEAEVREDEEHILQDVINTTNLLEEEWCQYLVVWTLNFNNYLQIKTRQENNLLFLIITNIASKQFQDKCGHTAIDSYQYVDAG